jgi:hypothetical protein
MMQGGTARPELLHIPHIHAVIIPIATMMMKMSISTPPVNPITYLQML